MRTLRAWAIRLAGLFHWRARNNDLNEEIESHLEMHTADNVRAGMTAEEARRQAVLGLGGVESVKEAYRDRSSVPFLEHLVVDVRFTIRQLRRNPGLAATAVLVLALGIGASTAIFAFVDGALIKPLPYLAPSRLVAVTESSGQIPRANLSYLDYLDWKRLSTSFRSFDVFTGGGFLLSTASGAEPVRSGRVSSGFFRTLGVAPLIGRDFLPSEEQSGGSRVVMLSYGTWRQRFSGRKDVVGEGVTMSGDTYTVIGVLPQDFKFAPLGVAQFWTPLDPGGSCLKRRSCHNLNGVARLKDDTSMEGALANMTVIAQRLEQQFPDSNRGQGASVVPLSEAIAGNLRPILTALMGGAGLLLLIACVNVASLVLVRSEGRRREMAMRNALGASLTRLVSQFFAEALVIVTAACAIGLLFAMWMMGGMEKMIPAGMLAGMPFLSNLSLNWHLLIYACVVSILATLVFSAIPLLHVSFSTVRDGLAEGSRGSAGLGWRRLGSRLVVVELATAMVLLVGAGLFSKSLYRLLHVELGFQPGHLATIRVAAPDSRYGKDEQAVALGREVIDKLQTLLGVNSVALVNNLPVSFNGNTDWIRFVGKPYDGKHIEVNGRQTGVNYFQTIGAGLLRGRYFTDVDGLQKPRVVIVNSTFAKRYFPNEDPIGKQLGDTVLTPASLRTIVGVVGDIKEGALDSEIWPAEYSPFNQFPSTDFVVVARTAQNPESLLPVLRPVLQSLHSDLGTSDEATMESYIANSTTAYLHRSSAWLVGGFATAALLLGIVGLYGVIAYSVSQRTREIGVRMALGAAQASVYRLVLQEAGLLAVFGIGLGAIASILAATLARNLLFGVSSWDAETLIAVAVVLGSAAMAASFVPARRAASVNPVDALRAE